MRGVHLPIGEEDISSLQQGEAVLLSGVVYTARDAAHRRMSELLKADQPLPFEITNETIYYMGPSPAPPGHVIGSAGPTTSSRMDQYTPLLLDHVLKAMIGKGRRSEDVMASIRSHQAVYFGTVGGAGAYLGNCIVAMSCIAFEDLGPEAIYKLELKDFPAFVLVK